VVINKYVIKSIKRIFGQVVSGWPDHSVCYMKKLLMTFLLFVHFVLFAQRPVRSDKGETASFRIIYGKLVYVPGTTVPAAASAAMTRKSSAIGKTLGVLTLDGLKNKNMKIKPGTYS
jgi:hypothetical protein